MNGKIAQSLVTGIAATIAMTIVIFISPMLGMPKMNPPAMMAGMLGTSIAVGWIVHFVIGITFAVLYIFLFQPNVKIGNKLIKGIIFGIVIFILAQIGIAAMGAMFGEMPAPEGSMILMAIGGVMGHVIFGIITAYMAKPSKN